MAPNGNNYRCQSDQQNPALIAIDDKLIDPSI